MRKVLLNQLTIPLLALAFVLTAGAAVPAAGPGLTMEELNLSILPEYDAMNVIVNDTGTFANETGAPFQGEIVWLMPKGAEVFMVCETKNGMSCQPYRIDTGNPEYDQVIWRPSRVVQPGEKFPVMFEYTMDKFAAPGARKFTVPVQPAFAVKTLTVRFVQPKDSSGLVLNPASTQTYQDAEGFTNYYYNYSQLKPFDKLSFAVSYTRNRTRPSKDSPKQGGGNSGGGTQSSLTAALLVVVGVTLGVLLFHGRRGTNHKSPSPRRGGSRKERYR